MKIAKLIYTCGPNWFYKTDFPVSDPHALFVDSTGKNHGVVGALEYDIAKERGNIDVLYSSNEMTAKAGKAGLVAMVTYLMAETGTDKLEVPEDFPAYLLDKLRAAKIDVSIANGMIFPERMVKTRDEIEHIRAAQVLNEQGFSRVESIFQAAEIGADSKLLWQGAPLTSELLQGEMNQIFAAAGCDTFAGGPIVAGGAQGAIPHERGHGQLYAHDMIVIDSFPQHANKYFADLTRTYIKGTASDWQQRVYNAVLGAQELALSLVKPEADLREIQKQVVTYFKDHGFETGVANNGSAYGYTHGIGHHVGLDLHEGAMQRSEADLILQPGHVVTIEPGLYYPPNTHPEGYGGCRIEDIVGITEDGYENLTTLAKDKWIIS